MGVDRYPDAMSADDRATYERAGFGHSAGFGERPALLVIDIQQRTVGPRAPVLEAIDRSYPTACGDRAWQAIDALVPLLAVSRDMRIPVMHPCVAPKTAGTAGAFGRINPGIADIDEAGYDFVPPTAPLHNELVIPKHGPSAFFGTPLLAYLNERHVDTLVLAGCTTSGCVRATAVDAFAMNYRVIVVADAVYDRAELSHEVNLFELGSKYADVLPSEQVGRELRAQRGG